MMPLGDEKHRNCWVWCICCEMSCFIFILKAKVQLNRVGSIVIQSTIYFKNDVK